MIQSTQRPVCSGVPPVLPAPHGSRPHWRFWMMAAAVTGAAVLLWVLFTFNPERHAFYPQCQLKLLTGLDCIGCGGLRATHQLLHGNLGAAFALNPLVPVGTVLAGWFVVSTARQRSGGRPLPGPFRSSVVIWLGTVAVLVFGVLRNLPFDQFAGRTH